jgi:hypothetical protein
MGRGFTIISFAIVRTAIVATIIDCLTVIDCTISTADCLILIIIVYSLTIADSLILIDCTILAIDSSIAIDLIVAIICLIITTIAILAIAAYCWRRSINLGSCMDI